MGLYPQRSWHKWGRRAAWPAGRIYSAAMRLRASLYTNRVLDSWRPPVPCLSVGNISLGASGKTPLAEWILQLAISRGLTPSLLTRGYRGRPPKYPFLVRPETPARESGDEPLLLARSCREALVVVDPRRDRGGQWVWERHQPDLFVLDDGMQHLRVQRDINLVLLGPRDLERNWDMVLPSGPWREGEKALNRADAFVLNAHPQSQEAMLARIRSRVSLGNRPVFSVHPEPAGLWRPDRTDPNVSPAGPYLLVSGVGRPERVVQSVTHLLGEPPSRHLVFPDHHPFPDKDRDLIRRTADALGCEAIVCTAKDSVKLEGMREPRLAHLDLRLRFGTALNTDLDFSAWLEKAFLSLRTRS
ncbi:MAG: tetraacyldisaccharide 4'-kinase [Desulfohalobiaceae bacterium]|nr:tetraacyldisaccharide 4'-kinase [Desulfohalobiaceae bacterium]